MPGFIGWLGVTVGSRMYTVTAWEDADSVLDLRGSAAHREAMQTFFGPDFAAGGQTGVWAAGPPQRPLGALPGLREMVRPTRGSNAAAAPSSPLRRAGGRRRG